MATKKTTKKSEKTASYAFEPTKVILMVSTIGVLALVVFASIAVTG